MAASLSMVVTSSPWTTMASRATPGGLYRGPTASLSFCSFGGGGSASSTSLTAASRSPLLHCSPFSSSFSGLSSGLGFGSNILGGNGRRNGLVVMASRFRLCQTKRNRSRKSLARVHGFRKRMSTTSGRAVLKRRRAKGRKVLCPKSNPNSGKRYQN